MRTAHLKDLKTPTLILQGTRDTLGLPEEIDSYDLSASISVVYLEDGDHSFKPRKSSGRSLERNMDEAAAAMSRFAISVGH